MRPIDADALLKKIEAWERSLRSYTRYTDRLTCETLCGVMDEINASETLDYAPVQQWISVKDRLPESTDLYLINAVHRYNKTDGYRSAQVRLYFKDDDEWHGLPDLYEVTHWMPLPEPPKEGDVE